MHTVYFIYLFLLLTFYFIGKHLLNIMLWSRDLHQVIFRLETLCLINQLSSSMSPSLWLWVISSTEITGYWIYSQSWGPESLTTQWHSIYKTNATSATLFAEQAHSCQSAYVVRGKNNSHAFLCTEPADFRSLAFPSAPHQLGNHRWHTTAKNKEGLSLSTQALSSEGVHRASRCTVSTPLSAGWQAATIFLSSDQIQWAGLEWLRKLFCVTSLHWLRMSAHSEHTLACCVQSLKY